MKKFVVFLVFMAMLTTVFAPSTGAQSSHQFPKLVPSTATVAVPNNSPGWNPWGDWIFPSVIRTDHIANPLGAYYMYTAPHNGAPNASGIALFYSDSLDGPWTPYAANPVFSRAAVGNPSHISGPHVVWNPQQNQYVMYFHGENEVTRRATSTDGINWTQRGAVVNAPAGFRSASYARVFNHPVTRRGTTYNWVMLYSEEHPNGPIRIRYALSKNGASWSTQRDVLVSPSGNEGSRIVSPTLLTSGGKTYVVYHGASQWIHATEVGPNLDQERHVGAIYVAPHRSASPTFIEEDGMIHMFYEMGPRLSSSIGHVSAPVGSLRGPQIAHSGGFHTGYFTDVPASNPTSHYNHIYAIERAGITTGYGGPTHFNPTGTVTRAEVATFVARAMDLRTNYSTSAFADVPPNTYYTGPVEALRRAGVISGTHFRPNDPATRQEMAVFVARGLGLPPRSGNYFVDVPQGTSFTGYIYAIYHAGITTGVGGGNTFNPTGLMTRQQMASFLARGWDL